MIVDLFAGPGGWDEGLALLGVTDVVGVEWDRDACLTAQAAGHRRYQADVADMDPAAYEGADGFIASPPCQAWSKAGSRGGEADREQCHALADLMAAGAGNAGDFTWEDARSALVCEPVRWVRAIRPRWLALEEVPAVASLWEHFARIFRGWGYDVWTGDLNAYDYGVPQRRVRRVLTATLDGPAAPPPPVETRRTMADALGWGMTDHPYPTLASARHTGGPDKEKVGGSRDRAKLYAERDAGRWVEKVPAEADGAIRIDIREAGVLQSFPRDYPWRGTSTKQFMQVSNAVPPLMAAAVLAPLLKVATVAA